MGLRGGPKVGLDFHGKGWITDARRLLPLSYPSAFFFLPLAAAQAAHARKAACFQTNEEQKKPGKRALACQGSEGPGEPPDGGAGGHPLRHN